MKSKQWGKNVSWDVKMHCHSVSCSSTREELAVSIRERSMKIVFWKTTACRVCVCVCVCVCVWHCRLWEEQQRARSDPQRRLSRNILAVNKEWRYGWRIQRINRSTHWLGAHSKENIKLKVGAAFPVLPTVCLPASFTWGQEPILSPKCLLRYILNNGTWLNDREEMAASVIYHR
jgi:hypothetical protein